MISLVMNRKQEAILAVIIVLGAVAAFLLYSGIGRAQAPAVPEEPPPPQLIDIVNAAIAQYDKIDQNHIDALDSRPYLIDDPLIVVDPYGTSPLTALVMFQTQEPMKISVHVAGRTGDVSLAHTFSSHETSHFIPVYGLYPGAATLVEITAEPLEAMIDKEERETQRAQLFIEAGELSGDFPGNIITQMPRQYVPVAPLIYDMTQNRQDDPEPPFFFTHVKKSAFDINGDYRWSYQGFETQYPTKYTGYGTMLIVAGSFDAGDALLLEVNMLGRIVSAVPIDRSYEMEGFRANRIERGTFYPEY